MLFKVNHKENDSSKLTKKRTELNITLQEIEETLARPEYKAVPQVRQELTEVEKDMVGRYENINSFGAEVADLFEDLCDELHRIPTQKEYVDRAIELTEQWWIVETLNRNPLIRGLEFNEVIVQAIKNRQGRGYLSLVNEMHTIALLKDMYPNDRIVTHDLLDLVMGIDIVLEHEDKRFYIHVYKDSYWGKRAFHRKEKRGGMKDNNGKFVKYNRDFSGDLSFKYSTEESDTTRYINGIPVFTREYIEFMIGTSMRISTSGERMSVKNSKLHKLSQWMEKNFSIKVEF